MSQLCINKLILGRDKSVPCLLLLKCSMNPILIGPPGFDDFDFKQLAALDSVKHQSKYRKVSHLSKCKQSKGWGHGGAD